MTWEIERDYQGNNAMCVYKCAACEHRLFIDEAAAMAAIKKAIPRAAPWQAHVVVLGQNRWFTSPKGLSYCPRCVTVATIAEVEPTPELAAALTAVPPTDRGREIDIE